MCTQLTWEHSLLRAPHQQWIQKRVLRFGRWRRSLLLVLNDLLQWELPFTEVLNLGKGMVVKKENKYSSLYFGGYSVFPLSQHVYRQDLTRLPHLA